jgi:hypothetical protein
MTRRDFAPDKAFDFGFFDRDAESASGKFSLDDLLRRFVWEKNFNLLQPPMPTIEIEPSRRVHNSNRWVFA